MEKLREHMTHFDDCGCLSFKYKEEIEKLKDQIDVITTNYFEDDLEMGKEISRLEKEKEELLDSLKQTLEWALEGSCHENYWTDEFKNSMRKTEETISKFSTKGAEK